MSDETLKNFMEEFFDFDCLLKSGFYKPEMRGDYQAQAKRVCEFFGFKTVYEYGAIEVTCHITDGKEPFVTKVKNIYTE